MEAVKERILICGDRWWKRLDIIYRALEMIGLDNIECIIQGECKGADKLGKKAALKLGVPEDKIMGFPALWNAFGLAAGPIRNRQQYQEGKTTLVLAFHNDIGKSVGTRDMIKVAKAGGTRVIL